MVIIYVYIVYTYIHTSILLYIQTNLCLLNKPKTKLKTEPESGRTNGKYSSCDSISIRLKAKVLAIGVIGIPGVGKTTFIESLGPSYFGQQDCISTYTSIYSYSFTHYPSTLIHSPIHFFLFTSSYSSTLIHQHLSLFCYPPSLIHRQGCLHSEFESGTSKLHQNTDQNIRD